jgi:hypothetical protein
MIISYIVADMASHFTTRVVKVSRKRKLFRKLFIIRAPARDSVIILLMSVSSSCQYPPPHVSILLLTNTVTFTTSARPELRVKVTVLGLVQLTTTN